MYCGIEQYRVQAHASRTGLPVWSRAVSAEAGQFLPVLAAIGGFEQGRIFDSRVDRVRIGERRLEMPDALELPGMLRAVVKLMGGERSAGGVVHEFVALPFGHAAGS